MPEVLSPDWLLTGSPHVWRPYCQHATAPPPLAITGSEGSRLLLADGRALVDGTASWWTAAHGYRHPHIRARVQAQLEQLPHIAFGGLAHEAGYTLASRIADQLPETLNRVFFSESGSVAVEVALKMALQFHHNRGDNQRRRVVCFEDAYHGDTFATMALCDPETGMHGAFNGFGIDAVHVSIPTLDSGGFERELARISETVACVIIEPLVQCAGGMRFHDRSQLQRIRRACDEHGLLLIFDEIATGFYRTGARFAFIEADVVPDLLVLGKALTGGTLPLAATVATNTVFDAFLSDIPANALQHGPTYMGNPLACAAAHASLDLFDAGDFAARVQGLSERLRDGANCIVRGHHVRDVRVKGALLAVELSPGKAPPSEYFAARGAFVRPLRSNRSDVVYLAPPLIIDDNCLDILVRAVVDAVASVA